MSDATAAPNNAPTVSPPAAPRPASEATPDPRGELLRLAQMLRHGHSAQLLTEYLRLRRAIRQ